MLERQYYVHVLSLIPNLFYGVLVVYGYYGNGSSSGSMQWWLAGSCHMWMKLFVIDVLLTVTKSKRCVTCCSFQDNLVKDLSLTSIVLLPWTCSCWDEVWVVRELITQAIVIVVAPRSFPVVVVNVLDSKLASVFLSGKHCSTSVNPFVTRVILLLVWQGVHVPSRCHGAWFLPFLLRVPIISVNQTQFS